MIFLIQSNLLVDAFLNIAALSVVHLVQRWQTSQQFSPVFCDIGCCLATTTSQNGHACFETGDIGRSTRQRPR
ncbi:MAG: hypothetical protein COB16_17415 [Rhodobacteraceae bacterium]|nr:MAG: hypothetical protein COB16_17415 [Paracoccaceae bacterium]